MKTTPASVRVSRIFSGKPSANAFRAGRDAGEQAEAGIGEEQHHEQRPGDLHGGEEHLGDARAPSPPPGR